MKVTTTKTGKVTILLTRMEAEKAYAQVRSDWNDPEFAYDAALCGRVGSYEMTDRDLIEDVAENWMHWLDIFKEALYDEALEHAGIELVLNILDPEEMPDNVTVRIEKWKPDATQRASMESERAKQRTFGRLFRKYSTTQEP